MYQFYLFEIIRIEKNIHENISFLKNDIAYLLGKVDFFLIKMILLNYSIKIFLKTGSLTTENLRKVGFKKVFNFNKTEKIQ